MKHYNNTSSDSILNENSQNSKNSIENKHKNQKSKLINPIYDFSYNNTKDKNKRKNLIHENEYKTNNLSNIDGNLNKNNNFIYVRKYLEASEKTIEDKNNNLNIYQFKSLLPKNILKKQQRIFNSQNSKNNNANNNDTTLYKDKFFNDYNTKIFYSSQENFSPPKQKILYEFDENSENNLINIHCGEIYEKDTTSDSEKNKNNKKSIIENLNNDISILNMRIDLLKKHKKEKFLESLKTKVECQKIIDISCLDKLNTNYENDFIKLANEKNNLKVQLLKNESEFLKKWKHNEILENENLEFDIKKIELIKEILNAREKIKNYYKFNSLNNKNYKNSDSDDSIEEQTIKDCSTQDYLETITHKMTSSLVENIQSNRGISNKVTLFHAKFILNNKKLKK